MHMAHDGRVGYLKYLEFFIKQPREWLCFSNDAKSVPNFQSLIKYIQNLSRSYADNKWVRIIKTMSSNLCVSTIKDFFQRNVEL